MIDPLIDDLNTVRVLAEIDRGVASTAGVVAIPAARIKGRDRGAGRDVETALYTSAAMPVMGGRRVRGPLDECHALAGADRDVNEHFRPAR